MPFLEWCKAMADPTRLRIIGLTLAQELNVQELTEILAMGQSRISRHLKILSACGLLGCRRDGLWSFYGVPAGGPSRRFVDAVVPLLREEPFLKEDQESSAERLAAGLSRSRRFFDTLAPEWDRRRQEILGAADLDAEILRRLPPCAVAADLGCGTGALLQPILRQARSAIGVDGSPEMIALARRRCAAAGEAIQLRLGELEHLPLRDGEADTAVLNLVLHHLRAPLAGLQEAYRVLRAGGLLLLTDFARHAREELRERFGDRWLGFTSDQLEGWLREAGFSLEERAEVALTRGLAALIVSAKKSIRGERDEKL
jgi:ubiquinone/menaquinone biosynthesis C-methylase UbiE